MKYTLTALIGLWILIGTSQAQTLSDTTYIQPKTRSATGVISLPHPHKEEVLIVTMGHEYIKESSLKVPGALIPIGLQLVDSTGASYPYRPVRLAKEMEQWAPANTAIGANLVAFQVDEQDRYHLYFYQWYTRTIHVFRVDPRSGEEKILPSVYELKENETLLAIVGPTPQGLIIATVQEQSSIVHLHRLETADWLAKPFRSYDLSMHGFSDTPPFQNFHSFVYGPPGIDIEFYISGLSPWEKYHTETNLLVLDIIEIGQNLFFQDESKFYVDAEKAVFTTNRESYTFVATFPFKEGSELDVYRLQSTCKPCRGTIETPHATVAGDYVFQVHSSRRAMQLQVLDLQSGNKVFEQIFKGNALQPVDTEDGMPPSKFKARRKSWVGISALPVGEGKINVRLGPYFLNRQWTRTPISQMMQTVIVNNSEVYTIDEGERTPLEGTFDTQNWEAGMTPLRPVPSMESFFSKLSPMYYVGFPSIFPKGKFDIFANPLGYEGKIGYFYTCGPYIWEVRVVKIPEGYVVVNRYDVEINPTPTDVN